MSVLRPGINASRKVKQFMVRVMLVDDQALWRRFVAKSLERKSGIDIVGEAGSGCSGLQKAIDLQPDVVFLDIGLSDLNGIDVARGILERLPKVRIIFLTQYSSQDILDAALRTGAYGYVTKVHANELLGALEAVLSGKKFIRCNVDKHVA